MHYKIIISDSCPDIYKGICQQLRTLFEIENNTIEILDEYEYGENNKLQTYIFMGTSYQNRLVYIEKDDGTISVYQKVIPDNSIVVNLENEFNLFKIIYPYCFEKMYYLGL